MIMSSPLNWRRLMSPSTIIMRPHCLFLWLVDQEEASIVGWCRMWMTLLLLSSISVKKSVQKIFCESFGGYRRICKERMENNHLQQSWKLKLSFRNATILVCFFNIITFLLLLQGFLSALSNKRTTQDPEQMRYIMESEEIRRSLQPLDLIKRVREIEQEAYTEPEPVHQKVSKQAAAVDLSKRLKNPRGANDGNTQKALEEWYKRKMERARQRELEKNGTVTSQA